MIVSYNNFIGNMFCDQKLQNPEQRLLIILLK